MATFNKSLCLLLVIYKITWSLGAYYISTSQRGTYEDKQCRMAVPGISKKGEARLDIKDLMDMDETLWIGYFKSEMAFEYIGCVKESDIPTDQNLSKESINGSLHKCYKKCQDLEVIGVTKEKCYCFDSSPHSWNKSLHHSSCNAFCKNSDSVFCRGTYTDGFYVSLYRTNPTVIQQKPTDNSKDNKKCLEFIPSKRDFDWKRCSDEKVVMYENTTSGALHAGYLQKEKKGEYFLRFTDGVSKKRVLCENETTDTTTSRDDQYIQTTQPSPGTKTTDTTKSRDDQQIQTTQPSPDSQTTGTTKSRDDQQIQTTQPSPDTNTGTAAIVSMIVVLVIIAIVIAVVLLHRRCKSSLRLDNRPKTETVAEYEYNYPEFTNKSTNAEANTPGDVLYNYPDFTLQDASNTGEIRIGLNTYDDSNIDGTYNKTNTGKKGYSSTYANEDCECNDEQAERVYNQLENDDYNVLGTRQKMVPDKTYDQAIQVQKSGTSASDDITYDSSMSSGVKLKKNVGGVTDNVYNTGNEIYNRIGEETETSGGKSDNLYGTKQMEKCKYMKPASDTDSQTYNSTSEISETCGLTDNPYSKLDTEHKDK
ncbi:uncharacterized protein LOC128553498 isoform X2 [Mercenaria mercenaria]|uniref:uncharacterized protein LOC128553498 isoform X2 n=1 Tax=Mercenaria mercenaria TaxID=6596 RepID=UPI00234F19A1|nr:uncharacterized protein LOC128553498 isoform X2 [Mercenaria mercenaria]XP_053390644.1 uncharacterized protein LOC128553498 isoform X2 [Mercenaria mercenaria]XP_053390646.1 uncharacterized protein LOC128553498 isoform X2 [Mercenaria mercenaria]